MLAAMQALSHAALGGEHRDHLPGGSLRLLPCGVGFGLASERAAVAAAFAAAWASSSIVWEIADDTARARLTAVVSPARSRDSDDLAHAAAQGGRQRMRVHRLPEQDHAQVGLVHSGPLGEDRGVVDRRPTGRSRRRTLAASTPMCSLSASMESSGTDPWSIACSTLNRDRSVSTIAVIQQSP